MLYVQRGITPTRSLFNLFILLCLVPTKVRRCVVPKKLPFSAKPQLPACVAQPCIYFTAWPRATQWPVLFTNCIVSCHLPMHCCPDYYNWDMLIYNTRIICFGINASNTFYFIDCSLRKRYLTQTWGNNQRFLQRLSRPRLHLVGRPRSGYIREPPFPH
jgi:hypothetical protein